MKDITDANTAHVFEVAGKVVFDYWQCLINTWYTEYRSILAKR